VIGWKPKFNDPNVASVRYRCLNPLTELQRRSFQIELFDPERCNKYSAVIFSKLYDEQNYQLAIKLKSNHKSVIFDICDNHLYNPYGTEKFKVVRDQVLRMLSISDLVITSTETLADVLVQETELQTRPTVIGDAIEEDLFELGSSASWFRRIERNIKFHYLYNKSKVNVLWFGIHGGENAPYGMLDLLNQKDLMIAAQRIHPFRLIIASNSRDKFLEHIKPFPFETHYCEWTLAEFGHIVLSSDICVLPITRNPFTICKSNNRLATALYAGIPTIADSIPSYSDLSKFCVLDDWENGLRNYLRDPLKAKEHARPAKNYIKARYSIAEIGSQWADHLAFVNKRAVE
jgi:hypothetical protein